MAGPAPRKRALVIEARSVHGFLIPTQVALLGDAGYEVDVVVTASQLDMDLVSTLGGLARLVVLKSRVGWRVLGLYLSILAGTYQLITLNTVADDWMLLLLLQPRRFRVIIHRADVDYFPFANPRAVCGTNSLKYYLRRAFMTRAERLYFLSQTAAAHVRSREAPWRHKLDWFQPAYFPGLKFAPPAADSPKVIFAVLGEIDPLRRDYASLLAALFAPGRGELCSQIEIRLLGNPHWDTGKAFVAEATRLGLMGSVIKVQKEPFIPFLAFAEQLAASHFTLLLLDDSLPTKYNQLAVPSSLMLSPGFGVPMVSSTELALDAEHIPFTQLYEGRDVATGIAKAVEIVRSGGYPDLRARLEAHMKATFAGHRDRYIGRSSHVPG